ncbi:MAG: sugar phosphate isomerase/epimerase [Clostridia bacterium]|nr:sugar phosphate isomerase/epimerase [Clostridia bacterium]
MKISTEIGSISRLVGEEKAIEYVANSGFDAWDFSLFELCRYDRVNKKVIPSDHPLAGKDYLKFAKRLKEIGLNNGIICNQTHAPFPLEAPEVRDSIKKAIECTAEVGAEICVIHPQKLLTHEQNAQMYMEYLPFAKSCGVKIAAENIWIWDPENQRALHAACSTPQSFCDHIDAVGDDSFVACLDIGHAEMMGEGVSASKMIKALGKRLGALHIHDNDKRHDCHQIPFSMDIDFVSVVSARKKIDYKGYFTLESNDYLKNFTKDNVHIAVDDFAKAAKKLANMFDSIN